MTIDSIAVVSGGMDSIAMLYLMVRERGFNPQVVSFDYGQRHAKELIYAKSHAAALGLPHVIINLRLLRDVLKGSALTDDSVAVPDGHYAEDSMKATVVPNRNMIMLSVAVGMAVSMKAKRVGVGVHAGDHTIYPDCRPEFIEAMLLSVLVGNKGHIDPEFHFYTPFLYENKADIVRMGTQVETPFGATWSCYKGGAIHCGTCGTCYERREAFIIAGVQDPTVYQSVNSL